MHRYCRAVARGADSAIRIYKLGLKLMYTSYLEKVCDNTSGDNVYIND